MADLEGLFDALTDLHPRHRKSPARPPFEDPRTGGMARKNRYLETDGGQIDGLGCVAGIGSCEAVLAESEVLELDSGPVRILGLDALIRSKEALTSPKDRQAVLLLRALRDRKRRGGEDPGATDPA